METTTDLEIATNNAINIKVSQEAVVIILEAIMEHIKIKNSLQRNQRTLLKQIKNIILNNKNLMRWKSNLVVKLEKRHLIRINM